jgi:hypothetical protein
MSTQPTAQAEMQKLITEVLAGYVALWQIDAKQDVRHNAKAVRDYIRQLESQNRIMKSWIVEVSENEELEMTYGKTYHEARLLLSTLKP